MSRFVCHSLTGERWRDVVALFGEMRGASGGCWCMYWRSRGSQKAFHAGDRSARREALCRLVAESAVAPGLIAYLGDVPVGWVAVAPRAAFPRFEASKASRLPLSDDREADIWAITCFYIDKSVRGQGLMRPLIAAAVGFATSHGASAVDAAPLDVSRALVAGEGYVGVASAFRAEGFTVIQQTSTAKPLMRRTCAS